MTITSHKLSADEICTGQEVAQHSKGVVAAIIYNSKSTPFHVWQNTRGDHADNFIRLEIVMERWLVRFNEDATTEKQQR